MARGDHLKVTRDGATDHAIDVGDRTVIRWRAGVGLERVERAAFAPGDARVEVVVHRERIHRPPVVLARAFSRFVDAAYRNMFESAEQFAAWCKGLQLPPVSGSQATASPAASATRAKPPARARPAAARKARSLRAKATPRAKKKGVATGKPKASRKAQPAPRKRPAKKIAARKAAPRKKAPKKGRRR